MPSTRFDVTLFVCATFAAIPAAPAWRALGDPYWEAAAWFAKGQGLAAAGSADAIPAFEEALRGWRAASAPLEEADTLAAMGTLLNQAGRSKDALGRFEEALAIARGVSAPGLEARGLNGVGESRALLYESQEAFDTFTELLALQRRLGDAAGETEALGNLGYVYLQLGDYVEAANLFARALALSRRIGARSFEATLLNNLGQALSEQGDLEGARARYEEALALRSRDDPGRAYALVNLAGVLASGGQTDRALPLFEEALPYFRAAGNRAHEATVLDNLGLMHTRQGDPGRGYDLHMRAIAVRGGDGQTWGDVPSLHYGAHAELQRGRTEHARELSERALALVEERRENVSKPLRTSLLARTRLVYEVYVDELMALHRGQPDAGFDRLAFEASERARARTLLELVADEHGAVGRDRPEGWAKPLGLPELRGVLDGQTVVIAYLVGDDRSHVWAWSEDGLVAYELPARAELTALAKRCHELLATRPGRSPRSGAGSLQAVLAELSHVLLSPVAARLGSRRLAIVADGPLQYVPFAALPAPDHADEPLIVRHEIVTLPSVSTLQRLRDAAAARVPASRGVAVFADPVFDARDERVRRPAGAPSLALEAQPPRPSRLRSSVSDVDGTAEGRLGRLPFTRREALSILALAGRRDSRGALDFDASLQAVRAPDLADFRLVHFATHGLLNNARPELSGLVLSLADRQGRARDGFLSVEEILKLRWRADLVTLSGCRTGLGRSVNGEGLIGVTRAFMVAGVPRVVASLWSVDDSATAELMQRFYAGMLGPGRRTPAAALRAAQLEMRKTRGWSAPYYWAAFQLHGDWR